MSQTLFIWQDGRIDFADDFDKRIFIDRAVPRPSRADYGPDPGPPPAAVFARFYRRELAIPFDDWPPFYCAVYSEADNSPVAGEIISAIMRRGLSNTEEADGS